MKMEKILEMVRNWFGINKPTKILWSDGREVEEKYYLETLMCRDSIDLSVGACTCHGNALWNSEEI